jgi:hypothetical protein
LIEAMRAMLGVDTVELKMLLIEDELDEMTIVLEDDAVDVRMLFISDVLEVTGIEIDGEAVEANTLMGEGAIVLVVAMDELDRGADGEDISSDPETGETLDIDEADDVAMLPLDELTVLHFP